MFDHFFENISRVFVEVDVFLKILHNVLPIKLFTCLQNCASWQGQPFTKLSPTTFIFTMANTDEIKSTKQMFEPWLSHN